MQQMLDMAIIGAGAAGLSAAVNGAIRGKSVRVFSNKTNYLARAERVDNYLGFYRVNGQELMESFIRHAKSLDVAAEPGKVVNILPFDGRFMVNFNGEIIEAKTVIIAVGVAKMKPFPGEEEYIGSGVSYCATCDGMLYRGRRAVVCGSADNIVEEANYLSEIGVDVTFVSPLKRVDALREKIRHVDGKVTEIVGDASAKGVRVGEEIIPADVVFVLRNALAPKALIDQLALENGFITVNRKMETNIEGIFACGDCTGMPLQVAKAVGEGLIAALQAAKYIDDRK